MKATKGSQLPAAGERAAIHDIELFVGNVFFDPAGFGFERRGDTDIAPAVTNSGFDGYTGMADQGYLHRE